MAVDTCFEKVQVFPCPYCRNYISSDVVACRFCSGPIDSQMASLAVEQEEIANWKYRRNNYRNHMLVGGGILLLGLVATLGSLLQAAISNDGRHFIITIGLILAGAADFLYGLTGWLEESKKETIPGLSSGSSSSQFGENEKTAGFTNRLGMEFVQIPAGRFWMGASPEEVERRPLVKFSGFDETQMRTFMQQELPRHEVVFAKPFWMGRFPVTQKQWATLMGSEFLRYFTKNEHECKGADLPVIYVSWDDAQQFLARLNQLQDSYFYRLPSEAEWEYACRAGTTTSFFFGDDISDNQVNFQGGCSNPCANPISEPCSVSPAGMFPPNSWGLYDMHGNVREWCLDNRAPYPDEVSDGSPRFLNGASYQVLRGGDWWADKFFCRSAARFSAGSTTRMNNIGFRVVAVPKDTWLEKLKKSLKIGLPKAH